MHQTRELLEKYCDRITKELQDLHKKIDKSETLAPADLESMNKLLHSMKSVKTILVMPEYDTDEDDGYSGRYMPNTNTRRYSGNRYNNDGYSGKRSYSRDSEKSDMIRKLENMMDRVRTEDEALAIQDTLNVLNRMN